MALFKFNQKHHGTAFFFNALFTAVTFAIILVFNDQLDKYLEKMKPNQKEIYYFANTDKEQIKNSPKLEAFMANNIPVLFMTDAIDEFWLQNIGKYKDYDFKSISKGKVDLSKVGENKETKKASDKKINNINILLKVTNGF